MLKVRIIPTLLLRQQRMVKGRGFENYRDTGDPVYAARVYNSQFVDELIFLDIDATREGRPTNLEVIETVARECFMPLTIGGGVSSVEQIRTLLQVGADKVVINTAAIENPEFIGKAAEVFGSQCIVVGVDVKLIGGKYFVFKKSGTEQTELNLTDHLQEMERLGAGEIFINCIHRDGMMAGYDTELLNFCQKSTRLPLIACGGAGNFAHLEQALRETEITALAMASIYHFSDNNPIRARAYLKNRKFPIKAV